MPIRPPAWSSVIAPRASSGNGSTSTSWRRTASSWRQAGVSCSRLVRPSASIIYRRRLVPPACLSAATVRPFTSTDISASRGTSPIGVMLEEQFVQSGENRERRPACRRHRARLQQPVDRNPRVHGAALGASVGRKIPIVRISRRFRKPASAPPLSRSVYWRPAANGFSCRRRSISTTPSAVCAAC